MVIDLKMHYPRVTKRAFVVLLALVLSSSLQAARTYDHKMDVSGVQRVSKVFEPSDPGTECLPVIFAYHGFGDNRRQFSRHVDLHKAWPEALVVFPEGLQLPDANGKLRGKGWQNRRGMVSDRDLHYFDQLFEDLKTRYPIDLTRIYATGMSNGGQFAFLLMAERPEVIAAIAPVGIETPKVLNDRFRVPKPVLYMIGREEPGWRLARAQLTVDAISRINRSSTRQTEWQEGYILFEPDTGGADFVFYLHRAGHVWPFGGSDAIARFFRRYRLESGS